MKLLTTLALTIAFGTYPLGATAAAAPSPVVLDAEGGAALTPLQKKKDDKKKGDADKKEEKKIVDKRPEIKELLKTLGGHAKARGKEDPEAIELITKLTAEFEDSGPRDRKAIVKGVTACLKVKRKPGKDDQLDNKLFYKAADSLGAMGPESTKDLIGWIEHKKFVKNPWVLERLIASLGQTKDEDAIEPLIDLLPNHEKMVQAAAAKALSNFEKLEQKMRKKIFKEVLDELTRVKNMIDVDQVDPIERARYDTIAAPMLGVLRDMSGHSEGDPTKYRSWWNDNKTKDWDKKS